MAFDKIQCLQDKSTRKNRTRGRTPQHKKVETYIQYIGTHKHTPTLTRVIRKNLRNYNISNRNRHHLYLYLHMCYYTTKSPKLHQKASQAGGTCYQSSAPLTFVLLWRNGRQKACGIKCELGRGHRAAGHGFYFEKRVSGEITGPSWLRLPMHLSPTQHRTARK